MHNHTRTHAHTHTSANEHVHVRTRKCAHRYEPQDSRHSSRFKTTDGWGWEGSLWLSLGEVHARMPAAVRTVSTMCAAHTMCAMVLCHAVRHVCMRVPVCTCSHAWWDIHKDLWLPMTDDAPKP